MMHPQNADNRKVRKERNAFTEPRSQSRVHRARGVSQGIARLIP